MIYNTVFSPTVNGYLHIGHLLLALVNAYEAHSSGGIFIVRFDDNQQPWRDHLGDELMAKYADAVVKDFEWIGLKVDKWESQLALEKKSQEMILQLNHGPFQLNVSSYQFVPEVSWANTGQYPYAPDLTAEKVALDWWDGVNYKIRGSDLLDEAGFYWSLCDRWHVPFPRQAFIARLLHRSGEELTDVSKTKGGHKICEYREQGVKPGQLLAFLADCSLKDPKGPFSFANLQRQPVLEDDYEWVFVGTKSID